uniref:F-box protein 44 n=1 Tax=Pipistrellus kuhlii TaxID=59472 RepID=A0A7J7T0Q2_PIPKU|nr:F-box protein 44 [Pipistrellus kuhlii]
MQACPGARSHGSGEHQRAAGKHPAGAVHTRARPPAAAALPLGLQPLAGPHRPRDPLEAQMPARGLHHRGLGPACGRLEDLLLPTEPPQEPPAQPVCRRFAARPDCGSKYQLSVQLLSSAHAPLGTFQPDPATIQQKSDAKWREVSHTFSNYPPGVRYIWFQHGGVDTHYWAGWYGPRVTNSSITIGPPRCPDAPEAPSAEP